MPRGRADIDTCVAELAEALAGHGWMLATAESCTGGLIAGACTERPGSSAWFDRGFVTYSNEAKVELLGVPPALIRAHGAVSEPVAMAMAQGALARSLAHWAVAVTGVAGPGGGSPDKPVGTVWLAWAYRPLPGPTPALGRKGGVACRADAERHLFAGDRFAVREQTVLLALQGLLARTRAVR